MTLHKRELSILIPVHNQVCVKFVSQLNELCRRIEGLQYEIIVADDGSTDRATVSQNESINDIGQCRFIAKEKNEGAGATRNFLTQESRFQWLLFLDCDMVVPDDGFILRYLESEYECVINGGISIADNKTQRNNLRYLYEKKAESKHTASKRCHRPYQSFRSTNFLAPREVMIDNTFFEPMRRYEDVLWGKTLMKRGLKIVHIDNPLLMIDIDTNVEYMRKVDRDMATLHHYQHELKGFSPLLTAVDTLRHWFIPIWLMRLCHWLFGRMIRHNLTSRHPFLCLLNIYKLGYFLSIKEDEVR